MANAALFLLLGPLIGMAIHVAAMMIMSGFAQSLDIEILVGFAYAGGLPFAFFAWVMILVLQQKHVRFEPLYVVLIGLAAGLMFRKVLVFLFGDHEPIEDGFPIFTWGRDVYLVLVGLIPTLACWAASKAWDRLR